MIGTLYEFDSVNPYKNIAMESFLLHQCHEGVQMILWQNQDCVVFGRNQNITAEADEQKMNDMHILPVRRFSGGGAVFHDLGNLNYTFLCAAENQNIELWKQIVLDALCKAGIQAAYSGRNDIVINDKKISGTAWLEDGDRFMYHGTLMISADCQRMAEVLTPCAEKFEEKEIRSVSSRVCNMCDLQPDISVDRMKTYLKDSFSSQYQPIVIEKDPDNAEIERRAAELADRTWIYGESGACTHIVRKRMNQETAEIRIHADGGIIQSAEVSTDGMDGRTKEMIETELSGIPDSPAEIDLILEKIKVHELY